MKDIVTLARETHYPPAAFEFVRRGLDFTVQRIYSQCSQSELEADPDDDEDVVERHVTGQDLCEGLRDLAIREYGLLARTVLERWRIRQCTDFGKIVFAMVEGGQMQATPEDSLEDFANVFEFDEAFSETFVLDSRESV